MKNRAYLFFVFLVIIAIYLWIFSNPTLYLEILKYLSKF